MGASKRQARDQRITPAEGNCLEPRAFTLLELLVVLAIIGMLAALTLPALKGIRQGNAMVSAGRQLVDDLALARARAINGRTVVHVIFVPPGITGMTFSADPRDQKVGDRLQVAQFTTYALFAERNVGDQPGRPQYRYLTSWRSLPEGVFIPSAKFEDWSDQPARWNTTDPLSRPFRYGALHFPTSGGNAQWVPHITFGPNGSPIVKDAKGTLVPQDEVIPLARGSILYQRSAAGLFFDIRESPPGNAYDTNSFHVVRVDGLTGRARVETKAIY